MLFRSLTLFCSLALTARGFLLPPSIHVDAEGVSDVVDINNRLVKLDCPGCLFAESDGVGKGYHWDDGVENSLVSPSPSDPFDFIVRLLRLMVRTVLICNSS